MTREQKVAYVQNLSNENLIKEYALAVLANDYGSHAEYIADLKTEMLRRMNKEA